MIQAVVFCGSLEQCQEFIRANRFSKTIRHCSIKYSGNQYVVLADRVGLAVNNNNHGGKPIEYDPSDPIHRDRMHKLKNWTYASYACMECGNDCDRTEEVDTGYGGPFELWCYCERCDVETFHPRVRT